MIKQLIRAADKSLVDCIIKRAKIWKNIELVVALIDNNTNNFKFEIDFEGCVALKWGGVKEPTSQKEENEGFHVFIGNLGVAFDHEYPRKWEPRDTTGGTFTKKRQKIFKAVLERNFTK